MAGIRESEDWRRVWTGAGLTAVIALLILKVGSVPVCLGFVAASVLAFLLTPLAGRIAQRLGAVSLPGGRAHHQGNTPSLGGLAVVTPIVLLLAYRAAQGDTRSLGLLGAVVLLGLIGLRDDTKGMSARLKLLAQMLAAGCLVLTGWGLPEVRLPIFGAIALGPLEVPVVFFWVLLVTNAMNLIDGLDGLATCVAILACGAFALAGPEGMLTAVVGGACAGFLPHNLPRARIFLGDAGSLPLGVILAALALDVRPEANFAIALGILAFPLGDLALAILRRTIRGKPLFAADQSHVHHKAAQYLGSDAAALLILVVIAAMPMVATLARPGLVSLGLTAALWMAISVSIVAAGKYRLAPVLTARRSIQKLHVVRRYVLGGLDLVRERSEIEMLLRHMVEALGLHALEVDGIKIREGEGAIGDDLWSEIPLEGRVARFAGPSMTHDPALERERRTVIVDVVREAEERLDVLQEEGSHPASGAKSAPGPASGDGIMAPELVSR